MNGDLFIRVGGGYEHFKIWITHQGEKIGFVLRTVNGLTVGVAT